MSSDIKLATCHQGHTTLAALWDCPVCVSGEREAAKKIREAADKMRDALLEKEGCDECDPATLCPCFCDSHDALKAYDDAKEVK